MMTQMGRCWKCMKAQMGKRRCLPVMIQPMGRMMGRMMEGGGGLGWSGGLGGLTVAVASPAAAMAVMAERPRRKVWRRDGAASVVAMIMGMLGGGGAARDEGRSRH